MNELDEILEKADYFYQLKQQKDLLLINFQDACILAYAGGIFQLTPEFIAGIAILSSNESETYVLDRNQQAILIKNPAEFLTKATDTYRNAVSEYGTALSEIKKKRSARAIFES